MRGQNPGRVPGEFQQHKLDSPGGPQQEADARGRDTGQWRLLLHPITAPCHSCYGNWSSNLSSLLLSQELLPMLRDEGLEHCHPGHRVKFFLLECALGSPGKAEIVKSTKEHQQSHLFRASDLIEV